MERWYWRWNRTQLPWLLLIKNMIGWFLAWEWLISFSSMITKMYTSYLKIEYWYLRRGSIYNTRMNFNFLFTILLCTFNQYINLILYTKNINLLSLINILFYLFDILKWVLILLVNKNKIIKNNYIIKMWKFSKIKLLCINFF